MNDYYDTTESWKRLLRSYLLIPNIVLQQGRDLVEAKDSLVLVAVLVDIVSREFIERELDDEEYQKYHEALEELKKLPFPGDTYNTPVENAPVRRFELATKVLELALKAVRRGEINEKILLVDENMVDYPEEVQEEFESDEVIFDALFQLKQYLQAHGSDSSNPVIRELRALVNGGVESDSDAEKADA